MSPATFFSYRNANGSLADSGRRYRYDVSDGKEIIWMSERDGWSHLYLYDGVTGSVKSQLTRGAKYPWYDISRVGIYGGSAGGQNALGGLLFHPEFYKAAVSYAGCHDNRMDKIWWNEQWMGWPIGPQYAASSNVDNAYRLQGDLLLVVGEMDTNVDPSSTMQVVSRLIKHNKNFDLLVIPGANHGAGRGDRYATYGDHKRYDFFVRHLLGVNPPPWNQPAAVSTSQSSQ